MKISKIIPNRTCISVFLHTVLYCFHWVHRQVEGVRSAHGGSLRYEGIWQNSKFMCYCERREPRLSFEYKFVGHPWKLLYTQPYVHICVSSHCIVLFPLRTTASWRCAICTRKLFKVWRNLPNSKLICYCERGEPRLSFEYKFVGHPWQFLKLYPTVHAYLFFFTLYCIVSTEYTGKLKECEVHTEAL